jgi:hypothetical protein
VVFLAEKEKPVEKILQVFLFSLIENKKAKGEEKPEEELMGKCKSSPSFETAA